MKKILLIISIGLLNTIHGIFHIIQFIQSMILMSYSTSSHNEENSIIEKIMHNPIFALIMGIIGITTLFIGIKDYIHHKKCNHTK